MLFRSLYAKNLLAFLDTMFDKKTKVFGINWDDEIIKGTLVAKDGKVVHASLNPQPLPPAPPTAASPVVTSSTEKGA